MTSPAPWSVKGIDPKAREIAKDLARRSGMTLGEWLTSVIEDGAVAPGEPPPRRSLRPASESRVPVPPAPSQDELSRVLASLEGLSRRFEASIQEQAETTARFDSAIGALKADQARVAERLKGVEQGAGAVPAGKADTLRALEQALAKVAVHLGAGESRQREAMAALRRDLGEEISRVAEQVNRKVLEVEHRGADAIAQVGAEVTRVATAVEQRLRRADEGQAEALEKLGGEIARITERLSERIAAAERRASQTVEDVGGQMARVTDRLHQRQERHESELGERMRQSEERTARLLDEARQTIERRLTRLAPAPEAVPGAAAGFQARWSRDTVADAEPETPAEAAWLDAGQGQAPLLIDDVGPAPDLSVADPADLGEAAPADEVFAEEVFGEGEDELTDEPPPEAGHGQEAVAAPLEAAKSAEDFEALEAVAQAIAAAQAEAEALEQRARLRPEPDAEADGGFRSLLDQATAGEAEEPPVLLDNPARKRPQPAGAAMRGVLLAGGAAASIGLAATGYVYLHPEIAGLSGQAPAKPIPVGPPSAVPAPTPSPTPTAAAAPSQAAVALAGAGAPAAPEATDLAAIFGDAQARIASGDSSGVAPLRTAANLGYAPAQRMLGKMLETGQAGVPKDLVESRRWTQRAAANGDARGMHNLGLDYYEGIGGRQSAVVAAQWFRRAAQLGLPDSQYNLGRFYEAGLGVPRDLAEAYRWYLIAARGGDTESGARARALKGQLTAAQRAQAEALAGAFRPDPSAPPAASAPEGPVIAAANPKQVALAARALARLGYFKGEADGAPSPALGEAIQAYQRDRGLAANGQLSPELVQSFARVVE